MLLTLTGYLNYAFYSWSTEYIDPAVTTVIFGGWTFTTVLFVGWAFRSERRYERTSGALVGFMAHWVRGICACHPEPEGGYF